MNRCPFTLTSPNHNLLLTLLTQSNNTPHPWIKCHKCGKWRKLPPTLSALSPLLPSLPLTLQSLSSLSAPFLPFPFTCAAVHWDLDRRICSAIQDYQDIVHEWHQVPLKLVRANPRFDFYVALAHFLRVKGVTIREYPCIYGKSVDLYALYNVVYWAGGDAEVTRRGWWSAVYERLRLGGKAGQAADVDYLVEIYRSYFFEWQESRPAVFDDETAHTEPAAEGGEKKESGLVGGGESDTHGEGGGGHGGGRNGSLVAAGESAEVKEERKEGGEAVDEVGGEADERKEAAVADSEMRDSEAQGQYDVGETSVEERNPEAHVTDIAQAVDIAEQAGLQDGGQENHAQLAPVSKPANDSGQADVASS